MTDIDSRPKMMAAQRRPQVRSSLKSPEVRLSEAFSRLNEKAVELELGPNSVQTIIALNRQTHVVEIRGRRLPEQLIWNNFDQKCSGEEGSLTTGQISHPHHWLPDYEEGYFVRASDLGMVVKPTDPNEDFWVAVVDIPPAGEADFRAYPFKLDPMY